MTKIEYNGSVVATVEGGNTATLPIKDLKMKSDIVITVPEVEGDIPEFTEAEDFTLDVIGLDEELEISYYISEKAALPAGSHRLGVVDDANFMASNIKKGVKIFGLEGAYESEIIPEFSEVEDFTIYAEGEQQYDNGVLIVGYTSSQKVALPAKSDANILGSVVDENFIASNIKKGVSIFGREGTYEGEPIEEYDGAIVISGGISLISFTIDNITYQAEEGMTWAEWCASDYNADVFRIYDGSIVENATTRTVEFASPEFEIVSGEAYHTTGGGSN